MPLRFAQLHKTSLTSVESPSTRPATSSLPMDVVGNVLEYAPGGTSVVQTYSKGLVNPISVTVADNTLYVADQGNARNGYAQQVLEYPVGNGTPLIGIAGLGASSQLNEGIAVSPAGSDGNVLRVGQ